MSSRVYLDHNASTPLRPEARAVLVSLFAEPGLGNPSSAHAEGRRARDLLEAAREDLADLVGCPRDALVFTSGGTESNALALTAASADDETLAVTATSHPSALAAAGGHPRSVVLRVTSDGAPRLDELPAGRGLLSLSTANHETGHVQDVEAIAGVMHQQQWRLHADACQALGRMPLRCPPGGADLVSLASHKLGGPVGIGALVVHAADGLRPILRGGGQEAGLRAGTEAAVLASAFAAAARAAVADLSGTHERWAACRAWLAVAIRDADPTAVFHSPEDGLPNTLAVSFPARRGSSLVHRLDLEGCAVSHGSACASGSLQPSPVLLALGAGEDAARSVVRISMGHGTTLEHVQRFVVALRRALASVQPTAT